MDDKLRQMEDEMNRYIINLCLLDFVRYYAVLI